jgi:hypothetical protein
VIDVPGPSELMFRLEPGVLDRRAVLAFSTGQCHGLALALHRRTGWPLVAVDDHKGVCVHVAVRRDDGYLVDATGAHTDEQLFAARPGVTISPTDRDAILQLSASARWAPPAQAAAEAWVDVMLRRAAEPAELPPVPGEVICWTSGVVDGLQIRVEWSGGRFIDVYVGRPRTGKDHWVRYGRIQLPRDPDTGRFLVDFTSERLNELVDHWLPRFDRARAERKLGELPSDGER